MERTIESAGEVILAVLGLARDLRNGHVLHSYQYTRYVACMYSNPPKKEQSSQ